MLANEMKNYFEIKRQIAHDIDWTKSNKPIPFFEEVYHDGSGYVDYLFEENNKWLNLSFIYKNEHHHYSLTVDGTHAWVFFGSHATKGPKLATRSFEIFESVEEAQVFVAQRLIMDGQLNKTLHTKVIENN